MAHRHVILIVDGEAAVSQLMALLLGARGYEIRTARTGQEGLFMANGSVDLVLLSISLPDVDGLKVCHLLKFSPKTKHIPVIMLSRHNRNGDSFESFHVGADDYLHRPFESEELFARVEAVLNRTYNGNGVHKEETYVIIDELNHILDDECVLPFFQPIYLLNPMRLYGLEVLSRPQTDGILSSPEALFKAAMLHGRYHELEMIVWRKALLIAQRNFGPEHLFLNCNPYLIEGNQPEAIRHVFDNFDMYSRHVILEITERSAIGMYDVFVKKLLGFRDCGFKIAIDDMGAGYASLDVIIQTKPDIVKIDRHIVNGVSVDPFKRSMVKLVVVFCRENGIVCIAEGIETKADLDVLVELGVEAGQGYYFYRPTGKLDISAMRTVAV